MIVTSDRVELIQTTPTSPPPSPPPLYTGLLQSPGQSLYDVLTLSQDTFVCICAVA